jgi:16S rRNA (uracil1498-N3)-methyltransferase
VRRLVVAHVPEAGERCTAAPRESHHLLHVIRARPGERVRLVDGSSVAAVAVLEGADEAGCARLVVVERLVAPPPPPRVVLLGLPKPALLEEALILGTEGGATRFVFVRARYSPPGEPRVDRLDRVLRTAVTQCGRADVPRLEGPCSLAEALRDPALPPARWLGAPGGPPGTGGPATTDSEDGAAAIAIGPEGGWSPEEIEALTTSGFAPLGLGPFVLRTPSAVGAALARLWEG